MSRGADFCGRVAALPRARRAQLAARLRVLAAGSGNAGDPAEGRRLVAYVTARGGVAPAPGELRAFLRERLPEPLVPAVFVTLPALPRTPSGKLDRRALPAPELARSPAHAPEGPRGERLAAAWAQVLGLPSVAEDDDFFELGGDSILVLRLCARARELGLALTPEQVYEQPTIAGLLAALDPVR